MFCFKIEITMKLNSVEEGWHVCSEIQSFHLFENKSPSKTQNQIGWFTKTTVTLFFLAAHDFD